MDDISEPIRFARGLASELDLAKAVVVGVYLHGSAALGGWNSSTSDVDLLIVVEDAIENEVLERICQAVQMYAAYCPGTGIECSVVSRSQAGVIRDRWQFLAHINAPGGRVRDVLASPEKDDPDLLAHYAVCHQSGIAIIGPPASEVFAPVPRDLMLAYLADEMIWGLENAPPRYALLNACRAREFLEHERIVSKVDAGELALRQQRPGDPLDEISAVLAEQRGGAAVTSISKGADTLVRGVSNALREVCEQIL